MSKTPVTETPNEFLSGLVRKIEEKAANFAGVNWRMQWDFTADGNDKWYIVIEDGKAQGPVKGELPDPSVTMLAKFEDCYRVMTGQANPVVAVATGKLKIKGDASIGQLLQKKLA